MKYYIDNLQEQTTMDSNLKTPFVNCGCDLYDGDSIPFIITMWNFKSY